MRGGVLGVMANRFVASTENTNFVLLDLNKLYGRSLSQKLQCKGFRFPNDGKSNELLMTDVCPETDFSEKVDVHYPK